MPSGLVELARQAAAAARTDGRAAREAPGLPATRYRGVHEHQRRRGTRYSATLWHPSLKKSIWLGAYATAVEAAYAYDAAARSVLGCWARPNFPELSPAPAARKAAAADLAASRRATKPPSRQQPAPRHRALLIRCWAPAPAGATAQHPERVAPPAFTFRRRLSRAESSSVATVPNRRELPHMPAMVIEPDQSVVGDNFTDSSAA